MDEQLCNERHETLEKRMVRLEDSWDRNLQRIYDKVEQAVRRPPAWVTIVIAFLSATCTGLIVALLMRISS